MSRTYRNVPYFVHTSNYYTAEDVVRFGRGLEDVFLEGNVGIVVTSQRAKKFVKNEMSRKARRNAKAVVVSEMAMMAQEHDEAMQDLREMLEWETAQDYSVSYFGYPDDADAKEEKEDYGWDDWDDRHYGFDHIYDHHDMDYGMGYQFDDMGFDDMGYYKPTPAAQEHGPSLADFLKSAMQSLPEDRAYR